MEQPGGALERQVAALTVSAAGSGRECDCYREIHRLLTEPTDAHGVLDAIRGAGYTLQELGGVAAATGRTLIPTAVQHAAGVGDLRALVRFFGAGRPTAKQNQVALRTGPGYARLDDNACLHWAAKCGQLHAVEYFLAAGGAGLATADAAAALDRLRAESGPNALWQHPDVLAALDPTYFGPAPAR